MIARRLGRLTGGGLFADSQRTGTRVDLTLNRPNQYNALSEDLLAALKAEVAGRSVRDIAVDLVNIARSMGLRVPEDLAVIGYDNNPLAALPLVDLSSIDQAGRRLGALAAETLLSRMDGRNAPHHILLEPSLVRRTSG